MNVKPKNTKPCETEGCDFLQFAKGLCRSCYGRKYRDTHKQYWKKRKSITKEFKRKIPEEIAALKNELDRHKECLNCCCNLDSRLRWRALIVSVKEKLKELAKLEIAVMKRLFVGGPFHAKEIEVMETPVSLTIQNDNTNHIYRREAVNHHPTTSIIYIWECNTIEEGNVTKI